MTSVPELSESGRAAVAEIAQRHGVTADAATTMLAALAAGNGSMAQFSHPEFGGSGQWMRGGMTMVSDLFDHALKARVDGVCRDLAQLMADEPGLVRSGSFQSQSQASGRHGQHQTQGPGEPAPRASSTGRNSLFVPPPAGSAGNWWPCELGWPDSTGAQNDVRYAYFPKARRLAIDTGGRVKLYDTLDHQIGGFSQQQSVGGSLSFSSQHGPVALASLPVVSGDDATPARPAVPRAGAAETQAPKTPQTNPAAGGHDMCALIEKLADLKARGILSDEEFASKKAELLARV